MESWNHGWQNLLRSCSPTLPQHCQGHLSPMSPGALSVWVLDSCRNAGDSNTSLLCAGVRKWPWQHSMDLESARLQGLGCKGCRRSEGLREGAIKGLSFFHLSTNKRHRKINFPSEPARSNSGVPPQLFLLFKVTKNWDRGAVACQA